MNCFVTGTDTGVGKTFFCSLLLRSLRASGIDAVGMKPICCGGRDDALALAGACDDIEPVDRVNPVWYRAPAAPLAASRAEGRPVDLTHIINCFDELKKNHAEVVVEGVGGWLVPVAPDLSVADLAARLALPVIVVAENRLGTLNHTLLTVRQIRASGQRCLGVVLNRRIPHGSDPSIATNRDLLRELLPVPILWELDPDQRTLAPPASPAPDPVAPSPADPIIPIQRRPLP